MSDISGGSKALLGLVIGMGVLIVVGITILGYGLYRKANEPDFSFFKNEATGTRPSPVDGTPDGMGDLRLSIPPGGRIESHGVYGSRLIIHLDGDTEILVIVNLESGKVEGRVLLVPETP